MNNFIRIPVHISKETNVGYQISFFFPLVKIIRVLKTLAIILEVSVYDVIVTLWMTSIHHLRLQSNPIEVVSQARPSRNIKHILAHLQNINEYFIFSEFASSSIRIILLYIME